MRQEGATARGKPDRSRLDILALFLIGGGLMILSAGLMFFMNKIGALAGSAGNDEETYAKAIPVAVNFPAPEIKLTDLEGKPAKLADFAGQVILINNWATWCPPCKAEMPTLQKYYDNYRDKGFTVIAIESGEPVSQVISFVERYQLSFPVWPDPQGSTTLIFHNDVLPSSYVVDRDGQIVLMWNGSISREMLDKYLTPILED